MLRETEKEVTRNKLVAYLAIATAAGSKNQDFVETVTDVWNAYVSLVYNTGEIKGTKIRREEKMAQEYETIRNLTPKIQISEDGKLHVSGLTKIYVPENIKAK